jgi:hypothetical protein
MEKPNAWDFVEQHYPNYYSSDLIAYADDLCKIINGEAEENSDAYKIFETFDFNKDIAQAEYDRVHKEIYEEAIKQFLNKQI